MDSRNSGLLPVRGGVMPSASKSSATPKPQAGDSVTVIIRAPGGFRLESVTIDEKRRVPQPTLGAGEKALHYCFNADQLSHFRDRLKF